MHRHDDPQDGFGFDVNEYLDEYDNNQPIEEEEYE
jgi:hypothetical protein